MKPPVDNVRVSSKGRDILIQTKRYTGLKQWNELLRWAFCISLANPDRPRIMEKLDVGIEAIEWQTFAGSNSEIIIALFRARAKKDSIDLEDSETVSTYFRAHIERGVSALRTVKSLTSLVGIQSQIARSKSGS